MVVACPGVAAGGSIRKGQIVDSFGCKREPSRSVQGETELLLTGRRAAAEGGESGVLFCALGCWTALGSC